MAKPVWFRRNGFAIRAPRVLASGFGAQVSAFRFHFRVLHFASKRYSLPLRTPLRTAHGPWTVRDGLLVRLEDDAGGVGFGEIAPVPWFGTETVAEAAEVCAKLGDRIDDSAAAAIESRFGCVRFGLASAQNQIRAGFPDPAKSELADENARPGAKPAAVGEASLLQSESSATRLPLTALLPAGRAALDALRDRLESGWLSFKWKVGVEPVDLELGLLDELLAALPSYAKLRLDANGAWNRREAARWLERCADRPVEFVEQPVTPADKSALLGLAADFPVKLALDESVVRLDEARRWQAEGWTGVFVVKPALAGPLDELVRWAADAKVDVVLSSAIETALGRAAILRTMLREPALRRRAPGFGIGEVFGDRRFDGPVTGPVWDEFWAKNVNPAEIWSSL